MDHSSNKNLYNNSEYDVFVTENRFNVLANKGMADSRKRARVNTGSQSTQGEEHSISQHEYGSLNTDDKLCVMFARMSSIEQKVDDCLSFHNQVKFIENSVYQHDVRLKLLEYKSIDLEARSRRNNLIIGGIDEMKGEDCHSIIARFLKDNLQIDPCPAIPRAHRLGRFRPNSTRAIIVYFLDFRDTELVLENANKLRNTNFHINRDFPKEIVNARKTLWPELKRLRGMHPKSKISIVFPAKIVADGRVVADMFPDWSQVLNGDRITTNAHHSPNGNYSHQSLSLKPHQNEVNHKSAYGVERSIPLVTQHNYSPNSNFSQKSLGSNSHQFEGNHKSASGDEVPTPQVTQHSQVHNTQSIEQYEGAPTPTVQEIHNSQRIINPFCLTVIARQSTR